MSRIIELITTRIVYYLSNQRFMSPKIPAIASFTLPPLEQHALDYVRVIITTNWFIFEKYKDEKYLEVFCYVFTTEPG